MKKTRWLLLSVIVLCLSSCSEEDKFKASGQWQLKTVDRGGVVSEVDTVFFAFQRGRVFSFTVIERPEVTSISYGYLDTPSDNEFRIAMDTTFHREGGFYTNINSRLLEPYGWTEVNHYIQTFTVIQLDGKSMTLSAGGVSYHLKKH